MNRLYRSGITDLHAHHERRIAAEKAAQRAREEEALRAIEAARHGTLQQLVDAYVAHLEDHGKVSAPDVRSLFARHVPAELGRQRASLLTVACTERLTGCEPSDARHWRGHTSPTCGGRHPAKPAKPARARDTGSTPGHLGVGRARRPGARAAW
jgi:hypothetical protein